MSLYLYRGLCCWGKRLATSRSTLDQSLAIRLYRAGHGQRLSLRLLTLIGWFSLHSVLCSAQPAPIRPSDEAVAQALARLRQATAEIEVTDPQEAIARYNHFYEQQGYRDLESAVRLCSLLAQLYLHELGDKDKALQIYDWALVRYKVYPEAQQLVQERELIEQPTATTVLPLRPKPASDVPLQVAAVKNMPAAVTMVPPQVGDVVPLKIIPGAMAAIASVMPIRPASVNAESLKTTSVGISPVGAVASKLPNHAVPDVIGDLNAPPVAPGGQVEAPNPSTLSIPNHVDIFNPPDAANLGLTVAPITSHRNDSPQTHSDPSYIDLLHVNALTNTLAAVPAIDNRSIKIATAIAQLSQDPATAAEIWQQMALKVEDVLYALDNAEVSQVEDIGEPVRVALAGLVVAHGPEQLAHPEHLSPRVRLWIAEYYHRQHDAQAISWFESLLAQARREVKESKTGLAWYYPPAVTGLGAFYQETGHPQKALDVYQAALALSKPPNYAATWLAAAARASVTLGKPEQAEKFYAQVAQYGNGLVVGLVLADQARELISKGQHEAARKLLPQSVIGQAVEQIQPTLLSLLAHSYYQTGDFEQARHYSQEAIAQYKSLRSPQQGLGLAAIVPQSETRLQWIERWVQEPIVVAPSKLRITMQQATLAEPLTRQLEVRTLQQVSLTATADRPEVIVHVEEKEGAIPDSHGAVEEQFYVQQKLIIQIGPQVLPQSFDATVTVSSPKFPAFQAHVPLHFEAQRLVK